LIVEHLGGLERLGKAIGRRAVFVDDIGMSTPFRWAIYCCPEPHVEAKFDENVSSAVGA
jgi:hypothetical protein